MGQKINPNGFRLGVIKEHRSRWFADSDRYPDLLQEDHKIRNFFLKNPKNLDNLKKPGISEIRIERKADQIDLEIRTSRPGVVVGRGGAGIEVLRTNLQQALGASDRQIRINVVEVARVDADAALIGEYNALPLSRRRDAYLLPMQSPGYGSLEAPTVWIESSGDELPTSAEASTPSPSLDRSPGVDGTYQELSRRAGL